MSQCSTEVVPLSAPGRFAPGHLGELTQLVPFEMVDEALAETGAVQRRVRDLPSRVVVYLLLAACLFEDAGYPGVWRKLTAGLPGSPAAPTAGALSQARRRVGPAPLRFLLELLRGPGAGTARWRGLLVTAVDGTTMAAPGSAANMTVLTKPGSHNGGSGYPLVRVVLLVACGTRMIIDAVFGPAAAGELAYARQLLARSVQPGMIVLGDRNFAVTALAEAISAAGAHVLIRAKSGRQFPVLRQLPDGSRLALMGQAAVRVIDCQVTVATAAGQRSSLYRLVTTLLDPGRYPAAEIARLYHERWEIETAYLEVKSAALHGRVLRARTPAGVEQELWALLTTYQVLRTAMADATATLTGTDPDRASFTITLQAARDQVIMAAGIITGATASLSGLIGRQVLAALLPPRRARTAPRAVKRANSKYQARGPVDRTTRNAAITVAILSPPPALTDSHGP